MNSCRALLHLFRHFSFSLFILFFAFLYAKHKFLVPLNITSLSTTLFIILLYYSSQILFSTKNGFCQSIEFAHQRRQKNVSNEKTSFQLFQKRTLLISNIFRKFPYLQLTLNQIKIIAELKIGDETECNVESDYYGDLCSTQNDLNDDDGVCRQNFS